MTDNPDDDSFISRRWLGPLAALLGVAGSLVTWGASQLIQLDARLDHIESGLSHLLDRQGEVRPSRETLDATRDLQALEARFDQLYEYLLRESKQP